ncbi:MAG: branched-chain amino acid ABC transporter permease [Candidatus Puniceispirillales bacterium]
MLSASLTMLPAAILNGLMYGAIYALVALGLTLIYGVLHIINFAHGAMLMLALYATYFLFQFFKIDPYLAIMIVTPASFVFGYVIYRWGVGKLAKGKDQNILLITLGLSIIMENTALFFFTGDQQTVSLSYSYEAFDLGFMFLSYPKLISFFAALLICALLWVLMTFTDLGKAIRAVAKERQGARLVGIDVEHIFAVTFGIGIACLGAAGCMLLPIFYVDPYTGNIFVIIAFTIVVLGGMGSIIGALLGGFIIGITESVGGLLLGESLGQIGISLIFILILIFKPTGLFGSKA